jgi:hypothetical protein
MGIEVEEEILHNTEGEGGEEATILEEVEEVTIILQIRTSSRQPTTLVSLQ